jgi:hypothetical protein
MSSPGGLLAVCSLREYARNERGINPVTQPELAITTFAPVPSSVTAPLCLASVPPRIWNVALLHAFAGADNPVGSSECMILPNAHRTATAAICQHRLDIYTTMAPKTSTMTP